MLSVRQDARARPGRRGVGRHPAAVAADRRREGQPDGAAASVADAASAAAAPAAASAVAALPPAVAPAALGVRHAAAVVGPPSVRVARAAVVGAVAAASLLLAVSLPAVAPAARVVRHAVAAAAARPAVWFRLAPAAPAVVAAHQPEVRARRGSRWPDDRLGRRQRQGGRRMDQAAYWSAPPRAFRLVRPVEHGRHWPRRQSRVRPPGRGDRRSPPPPARRSGPGGEARGPAARRWPARPAWPGRAPPAPGATAACPCGIACPAGRAPAACACTTPGPLKAVGCAVAATAGRPWFCASRSAGSCRAICTCCCCTAVGWTCCSRPIAICCGVGRACSPPWPPLKLTRLSVAVHRHLLVVDVGDVGHVRDVGDRAVVEEAAAAPFAAVEAAAGVAEAVVDAAVEADAVTPVAGVEAVDAVVVAPVAGGPQQADARRQDPGAGHPVIAEVVVVAPSNPAPRGSRVRGSAAARRPAAAAAERRR